MATLREAILQALEDLEDVAGNGDRQQDALVDEIKANLRAAL